MRAHGLFAVAAATLGLAMTAAAQTKFPSVLEGHAILPAMTLVPAPADAPNYNIEFLAADDSCG